MAHDRADDDRSFLKRKGRPNADPRANPERQIGKAVNRLARIAEKPVRIEIVWLFPQRVVPVEHIGCDDDHSAGHDRLAGKLIAKMVTAQEAYQMGMVNRVFPHASLMEETKKVALQIAANGAIGVRLAKAVVDGGFNMDLTEACSLESYAFGLGFATEDQKEGMTAFLEKRKPNFRGRCELAAVAAHYFQNRCAEVRRTGRLQPLAETTTSPRTTEHFFGDTAPLARLYRWTR